MVTTDLYNPAQLKWLGNAEAAKRPQTEQFDFIHVSTHIWDLWKFSLGISSNIESSKVDPGKAVSVLYLFKLLTFLNSFPARVLFLFLEETFSHKWRKISSMARKVLIITIWKWTKLLNGLKSEPKTIHERLDWSVLSGISNIINIPLPWPSCADEPRVCCSGQTGVLYASSLLESRKNLLHMLFPSGQSLLIRGWLGDCQSDLNVERMVEELKVGLCLKLNIKEVEITVCKVVLQQNAVNWVKANVKTSCFFFTNTCISQVFCLNSCKVLFWRRPSVCRCACVASCSLTWYRNRAWQRACELPAELTS